MRNGFVCKRRSDTENLHTGKTRKLFIANPELCARHAACSQAFWYRTRSLMNDNSLWHRDRLNLSAFFATTSRPIDPFNICFLHKGKFATMETSYEQRTGVVRKKKSPTARQLACNYIKSILSNQSSSESQRKFSWSRTLFDKLQHLASSNKTIFDYGTVRKDVAHV